VRRTLGAIGALLLAASVAALLGYREAIRHGFSARVKPWAIEAFAARHLRRLATGTEAKERANPYAPTPELLAEARDHYAEECALCHGLDGSGETEIGEGLYPPAPDLRRPETQELTDGELFAIIQNGVRFTGMPAWGGEGEDDEHWKVVLFLRHLPDLTPEEREQMREASPHHHGEAEPH
jgi:mono/diheme cytochrome c family protein